MPPKDIRNLLIAGRAIGGDRIAHAATRNLSCCAVAGRGAGAASAVSVRSGKDLDEIDMAAVQAESIGGWLRTDRYQTGDAVEIEPRAANIPATVTKSLTTMNAEPDRLGVSPGTIKVLGERVIGFEPTTSCLGSRHSAS